MLRSATLLTLGLSLLACGSRSGLETPPPCRTAADCGAMTNDVCLPRRDCVEGMCVDVEALDCDDANECTLDRCDSARGACVNTTRDADEDGHPPLECGGFDCDDGDALVSPDGVERCSGGLDEDCDGRTDCSDPDCFGEPGCEMCRPEVCNGGLDEDCDGVIDCDDSDCAESPECCRFAELICDDGRDDDCDGFVDCTDFDCAGQPGCCEARPEECNGVDDDCDGVVDDGVACFTLDGEPLLAVVNDQCGDAFYAYDNPDDASANPIPDVRRRDQVVVFVHHDTGGCGSSVTVIADRPQNGDGGALLADFQVAPARISNLLVSDENGECSLSPDGLGRCDWRWQPCCTDGVMIGPFAEDFCVDLVLDGAVGVDRLFVLDGADERARGFGEPMQICGSFVPDA